MDEKLEPIMAGVISFIKETTPDFKIALAGGYIPSLQEDIYDLSIFVGHPTTSENMQARIAQGKPTTFYTSCSWPEHPNQFTFSPPAESALVGWVRIRSGIYRILALGLQHLGAERSQRYPLCIGSGRRPTHGISRTSQLCKNGPPT